jgi:hypothetical protein
MKPARIVLAAAAAALIALAAPAAAQALTVSGTAAPNDTTAGANSDFVLDIDFDADYVENLRISLPPGLVGDPGATPRCTAAQLHSTPPACPATSQVGSTSVAAELKPLGELVPIPVTVNGALYNLDPQPGEPARFGIVLTPLALPAPLPALLPVVLESAVQLRTTDFGLDTVIEDIPRTTEGIDTHISGMTVTLFGDPGEGKPFMRNPTSCTPKTATITADSHADDTPATAQTPAFTPTGCDALDFSPSFSATMGAPGLTAVGSKPPLTTAIDQDAGEAGLLRAQVPMPPDVGAQNDQLNETCTQEQFDGGACPANSVIGSAIATSPLLTEPLTGQVALIGPGLPRIGLDLRGPLAMKLYGDFAIIGSQTGVVFDGLPDIPIAHFELRFIGGPEGLLVANRDLCQPPPPSFSVSFLGHNGAGVSDDASAAIDGCGAASPAPAGDGKTAKGKRKCKKKKKTRATKKKCRKKKAKKKRR